MNLAQLTALFAKAGCTELYAKELAENDNSKNQIYFAGAVETLNAFPSREVFAENTSKGPSFKALLDFGWLQGNGEVCSAPGAQLILYSQYPEVRFSGFLKGCASAPSKLMANRQRAANFPSHVRKQLDGRVLFLGVTVSRKLVGFVAAGDSLIASEFASRRFPTAFDVFSRITIPAAIDEASSQARLLAALASIHSRGWIDSKQLDRSGAILPCKAPQCGGFTLEAELGIPKNSDAEPDYLGWEVKQFAVDDFAKTESSKPITLFTPEPDGGFYKDADVEAFVRKFGYADKKGRIDRMNFGGRHFVGTRCGPTSLTLRLDGFDIQRGKISDAQGKIALVSDEGEIAASWSFGKILTHWSRKHTKAVYVPSMRRSADVWQYSYGHTVRLAQGTDSLRLLKALGSGAVYYDPGIKLENASSPEPRSKKRSQFRVASRDLSALYGSVESTSVL